MSEDAKQLRVLGNQIANDVRKDLYLAYGLGIKKGRVDLTEKIDKELYHWEDWILAESPTGYHDVKEYTADDMQRMICRTIRECKEAIEKLIKEKRDDIQ